MEGSFPTGIKDMSTLLTGWAVRTKQVTWHTSEVGRERCEVIRASGKEGTSTQTALWKGSVLSGWSLRNGISSLDTWVWAGNREKWLAWCCKELGEKSDSGYDKPTSALNNILVWLQHPSRRAFLRNALWKKCPALSSPYLHVFKKHYKDNTWVQF